MREIVYMPLDDIPAADRNPKTHDLGALVVAIGAFGYAEPGLLDERTGRLVGGHGRLAALRAIRTYREAGGGTVPEDGHGNGHLAVKAREHTRATAAAAVEAAGHAVPPETWERYDEAAGVGPEGGPVPDGVLLDDEGAWSAPVVRGWSSADDDEAAALLIALNRLTERGGWDLPDLAGMLGDVDAAALAVAGFDEADVAQLGAELEAAAAQAASELAEQAATEAKAEAKRTAAAVPDKPKKPAGTRKTVRNTDTTESVTTVEEIRPEPEDTYRQQWGLLITCRDEEHQGIALAKLRDEGYRVEPVRS